MLKLVYVALLFGLGFVIYEAITNGTGKRDSSTTTTTKKPPDPMPERAPQYKGPTDDNTREVELAAMAAVYERCRLNYVFREGSKLASTYVPPMGKRKTAIVNVSVDLFSPAKAAGNTLWFRVELDRKNEPTNVVATKEIAAQLCGMSGYEP